MNFRDDLRAAVLRHDVDALRALIFETSRGRDEEENVYQVFITEFAFSEKV